MSAALDCHQLRHYSDFETGSESGVSDLSYVHPYHPRKYTKRNKQTVPNVQKVSKRGARATRRQNNEAFLNSLSVIAETDLEEAATIAWPDSISHCSAFTKLFENESIRAVWDLFIALSEADQARLLGSFYGHNIRLHHEDVDLDEFNGDYSDDDGAPACVERTNRRGPTKSRTRHSRPGGRHKNTGICGPKSTGQLASGDNDATLSTDEIKHSTVIEHPGGDADHDQLELRDSLTTRFANLLSKSHDPLPISGRRRRGRRIRRAITSLDLCLIHRVECELRRWFSKPTNLNGDTRALSSSHHLRWTPTTSLLDEREPLSSFEPDTIVASDLLFLDAFERLLVHSVASYLGLCSYSNWSDKLAQRQLWVEQRPGQPFSPPHRSFINLIEHNLTTRM